jgi:hypothetical protein
MLFLTPHIKLLTLVLSIARQALKTEGNAFLRGDYPLYGSCSAKIWLDPGDKEMKVLKTHE